ncbi:YbfB/YjiJ family MFS transporter [Neorhizobium sp. NCHU2750]|uniref:YbfB/YjiJ family MFS transporter n=1 Tax=Neorhizobium sp. NCHU2750 TaxID=1825976 RepID=UPI001FE1B949
MDMTPRYDLRLVGLAGTITLAAAMGFGRFFYTPVLPGMIAGIPLSSANAGYIAAGNFAGYLAGAILAGQGWAAGRERMIALCALVSTSVLLAAMAVTTSVPAFVVIRFLAGLASALALILTSSIVLPFAREAGSRGHVVNFLHFGGVGVGIALSSALAFIVNTLAGDAAHGWRIDWLAGAVITMAAAFAVMRLLPRPHATAVRRAEPPLQWRLPLTLLTASYGLFGFGYVITATFLVTIARQGDAGPVVEFLAWFLTGTAAAVSLVLWHPAAVRAGIARSYVASLVLLAIGVVASVLLPSTAGALTGGLLLGATFMVITAYGLQLGGKLAPESPRRALSSMTAAFGVGQIAGPLVAGWAAEKSGSFTLPTLIATCVLAVAVVLAAIVVRRVD